MRPGRRLLLWLALLAALALTALLHPGLDTVRDIAAAAFLMVAVLDLLLTTRPAWPELNREIRHSIPVGVWSKVTLTLRNRSGQILQLRVHDHHPDTVQTEGLPLQLELPANRSARVTYRICPQSRGDAIFPGTDLEITSPMGFWQRKRHIPLESRSKVLPNFRAVSNYALLATDHRLAQIGVKLRQRRGEGTDFHQLREYRSGDSLRQIDWKATSRYRKLISKDYQDERDQQILFLLDCGRRMRHQEENGSHFDQSLNAMLLLAYVAARQGDSVGLYAFGGVQRWHPPVKGGDVVRRMLSHTYDIQPTPEAADYLAAAKELMPLQKRRALVVLITNTRDEDSEDLATAVRLLSRRHLVIVADLREELLDQVIEQPVRDLDSSLRFHGTQAYLETRGRNHDKLHHQGAFTLDLLARQLPIALVNEYLMVKASGRL